MEKFLEITGKKDVIAIRQAQAKGQMRPGCTEDELRKAQNMVRRNLTATMIRSPTCSFPDRLL